ncbi:uncharacterized protein LOC128233521 [Mya arenaria]|uniref:uncharacterized protein LOC128233521 n=1 Tax=Mya arenaria TaxID=6604 RepID=UPI0022E0461D|nr:uncharacterized protein LOC128233521 [Mya arenaria]
MELELKAFADTDPGNCIECLHFVTANSIDDVEIGDHIIFCGKIYNHHGIVTEKVRDTNEITVAEATNTVFGLIFGMLYGKGKAVLKESKKKIDFTKMKIQTVVYRYPVYAKMTIATRAKDFCEVGDKEGSFRYSLFNNNCEHFATKCVTGTPFSFQIGKVITVARAYMKQGFRGITDERNRNEFLFESNHLCRRCHLNNAFVLCVNVRPVLRTEDVQIGDIIRFSYLFLPHDGVVLNTEVEGRGIKCNVAHYAWPAIWKHRKIIEETITIPLDGRVFVFQYVPRKYKDYAADDVVPPRYDVYAADDVVKRARSRIGEEKFVSFSNDSSHFSRWCKLRQEKGAEGHFHGSACLILEYNRNHHCEKARIVTSPQMCTTTVLTQKKMERRQPQVCRYCGKVLSNISTLLQHETTHILFENFLYFLTIFCF